VSKDHPEERDLLLYLDGEAEAQEVKSICGHLGACWTCRMRASEMQAAIVAYASEREKNLVNNPPRPWKDLRSDFQTIRRSAPPSLLRRIRSGAIFRAGRVAVFCGAGTALAALGWLVLSEQTAAAHSNDGADHNGQSRRQPACDSPTAGSASGSSRAPANYAA